MANKQGFSSETALVYKYIKEDKLSELQTTMTRFNVKERQQIVNTKVQGVTPLYMACYEGKVHFVNYLLDECKADIEMKCIYKAEEDQSRHLVTPLWCAAVADKLEVVKTLVTHGADVNSTSDTDSTPVRSACYITNLAVIEYLIDHGADIHKPNENGVTCLINSVHSADLCQFLINHEADVNARDNLGNLALHYAIQEGQVESVKLLLKYGSDHTIQNDFGNDALQTAALRGCQDILEIIYKETNPSIEDKIRGYELLGTNLVDKQNDMVSALNVWKKAMRLRYLDVDKPILKTLPKESTYVYCHFKEPETLTELENLFDPEEIHMQTLLIRERILGPFHNITIFALMLRGSVYADSHRYQRCVDLWKYAYTLCHKKYEPLDQECMIIIKDLVNLFWAIQLKVESKASDECVQLADVLEVIQIMSDQITAGHALLNTDKVETDAGKQIQHLMKLYLHMVHLISCLDWQDDAHRVDFLKCIHNLVTLNPRNSKGETLLHLAVDILTTWIGEKYYSSFPSISVIKLLVFCGADVNAVCKSGNTPLHNAVIYLDLPDLEAEGIVKFLLDCGTNADIRDKIGESAQTEMSRKGISFCPLDHVSLRRLAAQVIIKHGLCTWEKYRHLSYNL